MDPNVLDESFDQKELKLIPASKGKRFTNLIIDQLAIGFFYVFLLLFFDAFGVISFDSFEKESNSLDWLTNLMTTAIFYCLMEGGLKGKSIGKYFTRTRAVKLDGTEIDVENVFKRSFIRVIPFEAFSFLGEGTGWHDRWSETMVIDEDLSSISSDDFV